MQASTSGSSGTPLAAAKPGINRANVIAWIIMGTLALAGGGYVVLHKTPTVVIKDMQQQSGRFALEGTVQVIDDTNKQLNALKYGSTELDMFMLVDGTGTTTVYFTPNGPPPVAGDRVHAEGTFVEQRGSGVRRFVASEIKKLPGQ